MRVVHSKYNVSIVGNKGNSNFRNPNSHPASDTPETLNYDFLRNVTQTGLLQILNFQNK